MKRYFLRRTTFLSIFIIGVFSIMPFILTGCGTPKLEDKQEIANYANMKNGSFNAKYTNLDKVKLQGTYDNKDYPNKMALKAYEEESNGWFNIIVLDNDKNSNEIKTKLGSKIRLNDSKIKITKAEVVPETLNSTKVEPTLLVNKSDIELLDENKFQAMLESNKPYEDLKADSSISSYIMSVKDKELKYDPKYADRVATLIKSYDEDIRRMNADIASQPKQQEQTKDSYDAGNSLTSSSQSNLSNNTILHSGQSLTLSADAPVCSSKENLNKMLSFIREKMMMVKIK